MGVFNIAGCVLNFSILIIQACFSAIHWDEWMHIQGKPIHPPRMIHGIIWVIYIINRTFCGMYIQVLDTCIKNIKNVPASGEI